MKAILEFILPEDQEEFEVSSKAKDLYFVIWDLDQYIRSQLKYNNNLKEVELEVYENIREKLYELLMEYNCNLNMLS